MMLDPALQVASEHAPQVSNSFAIYGSALAAVVAVCWALLERRERQSCQRSKDELSLACHSMTEQHYRERLQAEERHLLTHDSTVRNMLEKLALVVSGK